MNTTTHQTPTGQTITHIKNGSRLATITEEAAGTYRVALFLDYGTDGLNWCDGATYKTEAGALRKARGFLK